MLAGWELETNEGQAICLAFFYASLAADTGLHTGAFMTQEAAAELQAINTAWQIAIQEILRVVVRDMYMTGDASAFRSQVKRIEETAVDSIYSGLVLRGTDEWTEVLVKEKASNFVTTLLTSFTYEKV